MVGQVWPNDAVFPDFFNKYMQGDMSLWWSWLRVLQTDVPFGGIWLEMNEIENFCNGTCY